MLRYLMVALLLAYGVRAPAQTLINDWALAGNTQLVWDGSTGATLAIEMRGAAHGWNAVATLQQQALHNQDTQSASWVNELAYSHSLGDWNYSIGKKIVSWDVGYAFRPNDVVQQEVRRALVDSTLTGRPVIQAEYFAQDSAWTLVAVNPGDSAQTRGAGEPALAARYFQHNGALDWYGFARNGERTGASVGTAVAWVATDALELHASVRALQHADTLAMLALAAPLGTQTPWRNADSGDAVQALAGFNWSNADHVTLLTEVWWDGTALSGAQWDAWRQRNQTLLQLGAQGAPPAAVAGNLAWQGDAFNASPSLQRNNLYVRLDWDHEGWKPELEWLCQSDDGGQMATASLSHQGNRILLQAGLRNYGGPANAILAQLPTRQQAFVQARWAF